MRRLYVDCLYDEIDVILQQILFLSIGLGGLVSPEMHTYLAQQGYIFVHDDEYIKKNSSAKWYKYVLPNFVVAATLADNADTTDSVAAKTQYGDTEIEPWDETQVTLDYSKMSIDGKPASSLKRPSAFYQDFLERPGQLLYNTLSLSKDAKSTPEKDFFDQNVYERQSGLIDVAWETGTTILFGNQQTYFPPLPVNQYEKSIGISNPASYDHTFLDRFSAGINNNGPFTDLIGIFEILHNNTQLLRHNKNFDEDYIKRVINDAMNRMILSADMYQVVASTTKAVSAVTTDLNQYQVYKIDISEALQVLDRNLELLRKVCSLINGGAVNIPRYSIQTLADLSFKTTSRIQSELQQCSANLGKMIGFFDALRGSIVEAVNKNNGQYDYVTRALTQVIGTDKNKKYYNLINFYKVFTLPPFNQVSMQQNMDYFLLNTDNMQEVLDTAVKTIEDIDKMIVETSYYSNKTHIKNKITDDVYKEYVKFFDLNLYDEIVQMFFGPILYSIIPENKNTFDFLDPIKKMSVVLDRFNNLKVIPTNWEKFKVFLQNLSQGALMFMGSLVMLTLLAARFMIKVMWGLLSNSAKVIMLPFVMVGKGVKQVWYMIKRLMVTVKDMVVSTTNKLNKMMLWVKANIKNPYKVVNGLMKFIKKMFTTNEKQIVQLYKQQLEAYVASKRIISYHEMKLRRKAFMDTIELPEENKKRINKKLKKLNEETFRKTL